MNILSRICDIRPRVKYMMSRIRGNRPMSVNNVGRYLPFQWPLSLFRQFLFDLLFTAAAITSEVFVKVSEDSWFY